MRPRERTQAQTKTRRRRSGTSGRRTIATNHPPLSTPTGLAVGLALKELALRLKRRRFAPRSRGRLHGFPAPPAPGRPGDSAGHMLAREPYRICKTNDTISNRPCPCMAPVHGHRQAGTAQPIMRLQTGWVASHEPCCPIDALGRPPVSMPGRAPLLGDRVEPEAVEAHVRVPRAGVDRHPFAQAGGAV